MKTKVEYIKHMNYERCHPCDGTGFTVGVGVHRTKAMKKLCPICKGTGKWVEYSYDLIATQPDGKKIAFCVDTIK